MMGLAFKDILVQRKTLRFYLMFMLFYMGLVFAGVFEVFILGTLSVVMGMILPMSAVAYDDQVKWDAYACAAPNGRRKVVGGKYLFTLLVVLTTGILAAVCMGLMAVLGWPEALSLDSAASLLGCMGAGLLINCITLPIMLKFGAEKSRIVYLGVSAAVFGGGMLLLKSMEAGAVLPTPPAWLVGALPVVLVLALLIALCVSFAISLHICEKKEY